MLYFLNYVLVSEKKRKVPEVIVTEVVLSLF